MDQSTDLSEFLVFVKDPVTGQVSRSFIVPATDAIAARRLCDTNQIEVESIERYENRPGVVRPMVCPLGPLDRVQRADFTEYLVFAEERDTGKPWPLFIVPAPDKAAAERLCQRSYLTINAIEPYSGVPGEEKPRAYPWGPPASGPRFEREYHHRKPDPDTRAWHQTGCGIAFITIWVVAAIVRLLVLLLRNP
jgi:hypothetical protein